MSAKQVPVKEKKKKGEEQAREEGGSHPIQNFKHTDPSLSKQIQSNVSKESLNNKTVLVDVVTVFFNDFMSIVERKE